MTEIEEDDGWADTFVGTYAKSRAGLEARMKAERRAGRTAKQRERARKAVPKKQVNFRATEETRALIKAMAAHLDTDDTDVIVQAIHKLAESLPGFRGKEVN
jgi:hypothetical protein